MYLLTEWEGQTGKYLARGHGERPDLTKSISILLYGHCAFPFFLFFFSGNQFRNVYLCRSFLPKCRDLYSNKVILVRISRAQLIKSPYEGRTRSYEGRTAFSGPARASRTALIRGFSQYFCNESARGAVRVI